MKTSNEPSGSVLHKPEIQKPLTRSLEKVLHEIQEIINNTLWVETRLQQLKAKGYLIEDCWVKNGSIGTIWYMKRKQVYRIQITESELHCKYDKAFCVVIPFSDLSVQVSELTKMRNSITIKRPRKRL
jgi:hypothetical protein